MQHPTIDANIYEIDGAYYPVKLHAIPQRGDVIDLWSFIDQTDGYEPRKNYEVVRILHKIYDHSDKSPAGADGHHSVTVLVKPAAPELLLFD